MAFRIEIAEPAIEDIDEAVSFIAQDSLASAIKWKASLETLIFSLQEMPHRFAVIPELVELKMPYRCAIHNSYRIIFRIDEAKNIVYVVRVYHGARKPLTNEDL